MDRKPFERRFADLKQETEKWFPLWSDEQAYIDPARGRFHAEPNRGDKLNHKKLLDNTPTRANTTLASGMLSGLTSPSRPWFKLGLSDPGLNKYTPARHWLDDVQERMMAVFSKSNIYNSLHSVYQELGQFNTSAMMLIEDFENVIRARTFTAGEYYLGTGHDLRVNTFAREIWMTIGQMKDMFGYNNLSDSTQKQYDNNQLFEWRKVYHMIEPNDGRKPDKKDAQNMPFRSVYWEDGAEDEKFLRVAGYEEFPVFAPRWDVVSSDVYSRNGPGAHSLGDCKGLMKSRKDYFMILDKIADPPLNAPATLETKGGVNFLPGGVNYVGDTAQNIKVEPAYTTAPRLQEITMDIQDMRNSIKETFFVDMFLMLANSDRRQITAREVAERHEEKLLMLGPVLERLEAELLDPLIDRTFNVMLRAGILPPPPQELQGGNLKVEYISMLAQAQKMVGTTTVEQLSAYVGSLTAVVPEVIDKFNADKAVDSYADMLGVESELIRGEEEVAEIRKRRAEMIQQQQQMEQAQAAAQGAKVLSETRVGENSALDALLGGG